MGGVIQTEQEFRVCDRSYFLGVSELDDVGEIYIPRVGGLLIFIGFSLSKHSDSSE